MAGRPHDADEPPARRDAGGPDPADLPADDAASPHAVPDDDEPGPAGGPADADPSGAPAASTPPAGIGPAAAEEQAPGPADEVPGPRTPPTASSAGAARPAGPVDAEGRPVTRTGDEEDIEERWRAIVAELGDLGAGPPPPRRRATDIPPEVGRPEPGARTVRPAQPTGPRAWEPDPAVEEAEEHFTPPDPGPVLGGDPLLTMAWAAAVGVPVLLLLAVVLWRDMPSAVLRAAGVAFLVAVGLLLWRMPHRRDDDDRGPGAVV